MQLGGTYHTEKFKITTAIQDDAGQFIHGYYSWKVHFFLHSNTWSAMRFYKISSAILNDSIWSTKGYSLIHWRRVTHICVSKLTIIGSDNGL